MERYSYTIHIREELSSEWAAWFKDMSIERVADNETAITGYVEDQSALHGLLARIRDLNLTLISVNRANKKETN